MWNVLKICILCSFIFYQFNHYFLRKSLEIKFIFKGCLAKSHTGVPSYSAFPFSSDINNRCSYMQLLHAGHFWCIGTLFITSIIVLDTLIGSVFFLTILRFLNLLTSHLMTGWITMYVNKYLNKFPCKFAGEYIHYQLWWWNFCS